MSTYQTKYDILQQLHNGIYTETFLVRHKKNNITCILKTLYKEHTAQQQKQLIQEIRLQESITCEYVPRVLETSKTYYTMEYINGETLEKLTIKQQGISPENAINIAVDILDTLNFFHHEGVAHLDIKPENIIINEHLSPYLIDFGAATKIKKQSIQQQQYTPLFASPEQFISEKSYSANLSDQYSLATCLYFMLTKGTSPQQGNSPQERLENLKHSKQSLPSITNKISPHLDKVMLKALEINPKKRYKNCKEFADDLLFCLNNEVPIVSRKYAKITQYQEYLPIFLSGLSIITLGSLFSYNLYNQYIQTSEKNYQLSKQLENIQAKNIQTEKTNTANNLYLELLEYSRFNQMYTLHKNITDQETCDKIFSKILLGFQDKEQVYSGWIDNLHILKQMAKTKEEDDIALRHIHKVAKKGLQETKSFEIYLKGCYNATFAILSRTQTALIKELDSIYQHEKNPDYTILHSNNSEKIIELSKHYPKYPYIIYKLATNYINNSEKDFEMRRKAETLLNNAVQEYKSYFPLLFLIGNNKKKIAEKLILSSVGSVQKPVEEAMPFIESVILFSKFNYEARFEYAKLCILQGSTMASSYNNINDAIIINYERNILKGINNINTIEVINYNRGESLALMCRMLHDLTNSIHKRKIKALELGNDDTHTKHMVSQLNSHLDTHMNGIINMYNMHLKEYEKNNTFEFYEKGEKHKHYYSVHMHLLSANMHLKKHKEARIIYKNFMENIKKFEEYSNYKIALGEEIKRHSHRKKAFFTYKAIMSSMLNRNN